MAVTSTVIERVASLLRETARAHHRAYIATDGEHAEWASWYGAHLAPRLAEALGWTVTADRLAALIADADVVYRAAPREEKWPEFYAARLAEQLGP